MNLILQDVRKAYRLLADYQQRIIELITFIKKELDIEHFSYYFPNYYTLRYIDKIYNGESEIGLRFLPMMDFRLLLHKTKNISNNNVWQYNFQKMIYFLKSTLLVMTEKKINCLYVIVEVKFVYTFISV